MDLEFSSTSSFVFGLMTVGIAAVEFILHVKGRKVWQDDVLKEIQIYNAMEQSKELKDRNAMRALKKSITNAVEKGIRKNKGKRIFVQFLINISMLISSLVIGILIIAFSLLFDFFSEAIMNTILGFVGMMVGVECALNLISLLKTKE